VSRLTVDLNRDGLHSIATPSSFETPGPFEIRLRNHGEAVHAHLNLDDALSAVARLTANNHYVETESSRLVQIETRSIQSPVTGRLKIVTGYGAEVAYMTVTVTPPGEKRSRVQVDETLSVPKPREPEEPSLVDRLSEIELTAPGGVSIALLAFGVLAVGLSVMIALSLESPIVLFGSLLVVVGVIAALAITKPA